MRIALGSDHAGRALREAIAVHLRGRGLDVHDLGPEGSRSVDYPDYAELVSSAVAAGEAQLGILVCGTGIGMAMAANRVAGIRAAVCTNEFTARTARAHNDANVLCLGERVVGPGVALGIIDVFVDARFEGGRHARRVDKTSALERKSYA